MNQRSRAAVDVGSNSVRCLVLSADGQTLARELAITRLATGVDEYGRLDDDALARTLDAIERYHALWSRHGVETADVRIAATSAVRDASDRDRFFDGVRDRTGVEAEVITGTEEAETAYRGVSAGIDADAPFAVLDIGGGSTEIIVGSSGGGVSGSFSMQLGSVRLTERCLPSDPPTSEEVAAAEREVSLRLDDLDAALADAGVAVADARTLVGVAGTVTTVAALDARIEEYTDGCVHGRELAVAALRGWADRLASLTAAEIADLGPVQPGREDVITAGAIIAACVVERYGFDHLLVSESDILDGLAASHRRGPA